jgi:hypothetical protein
MYQSLVTRCWAGRTSTNSSKREPSRKFQPFWMWRIRLWALYCVDRGLGPPVRELLQARAAAAREHHRHGALRGEAREPLVDAARDRLLLVASPFLDDVHPDPLALYWLR